MIAQLPGQLDLLDLLTDEEARLAEGRAYIATEQARTPDTERTLTCPWCGYTSTCRAYAIWGDRAREFIPPHHWETATQKG